jgi:type VI secretion system protein VasD
MRRLPAPYPPLLILLLLLALPLAGCMKPSPTQLQARLAAAESLNPDVSGRPSPVVVRLYALRASSDFENADFFTLYDDEVAALKDGLLGREEMEIVPGGSLEISREFPPETRFLGVVAAFRDIDQARWRAVTPLNKESKNSVTIELGERSVSIRAK